MNSLVQIEALATGWPSGLVDAEEAARDLGITAERLVQLADAKVAPHFRIDGGRPKFRKSDLKRWAAAHLLQSYEGSTIPIEIRLIVDPGPGWDQEPPACLRALYKTLRQHRDMQGYCGVYFLCLKGELVYVGQSTNIPMRIAAHRNSKQFDNAYWIPVPSESLDDVESALIRHLRPKLNSGRNGVLYAPTPRAGGDSCLFEYGFRTRDSGPEHPAC